MYKELEDSVCSPIFSLYQGKKLRSPISHANAPSPPVESKRTGTEFWFPDSSHDVLSKKAIYSYIENLRGRGRGGGKERGREGRRKKEKNLEENSEF